MATFTGKVTGGSLAFRSSPAGTAISGKSPIPNGTTLSVSTISGNTEWFSTTYSSTSGYVMSRWIAITSGGVKTGTISTSSGSLNVRATPSASGTISFTVAKDSTVQILEGPTSGFYRISCSQGTGWASDAYITVGGSSGGGTGGSFKAGNYVVMNQSNSAPVNVRASTSTSSTKLGELQKGTKLYCEEVVSSTWVKVRWGGQTQTYAYIMSEYLTDGGAASTSKMQRAIDIGNSMANKGYPNTPNACFDIGNGEWCVRYVSFLQKAAGCSSTNYVPFSDAYVSEAAAFYRGKGTFGLRSSGRTPSKGDMVFYKMGTQDYQHVGLVTAVSGTNISTVEGNMGSTVQSYGPISYTGTIHNMTVYGFATPTWS